MAHEEWCGKPCSECVDTCSLDTKIPCSPDCDLLRPDGTLHIRLCEESECDAIQ